MGGLDVLVLRGICETFAERNLLPMLQELKTAQGELLDRIRGLEVQLSERDTLCQSLQERVATKADLDMVPSMVQFEELQAKLEQLSSPVCQTEDLEARLESRFSELKSALARKANAQDVDELSALVSQKANFRDVATVEQLRKLSATVDRKANTSKVPTIQQLQELQALVENKVDARLVPTLAQVEELEAEVKRKKVNTAAQEEMKKVSSELQMKANASDVMTKGQVEELVQHKVDSLMSRKADALEVPSLSEHKELAASMERKLSFLATKLQQKSEAMKDMYSQPQTVWCVQPAVVDVAWDERGQAWTEWNPSQVMPCLGGDGAGASFPPQHLFVAERQNSDPVPKQNGTSMCRKQSKGAGPDDSTRSGSPSGTSSTVPVAQEAAPER